jgi:two-component system sensor histidine kinase VanS
VAAAAAIVVLARYIVNNKAGDWIVALLQNSFHLRFDDAMRIYQYVIRNNLDYILITTVALFVMAFSRLLTSQFSKYFNEINACLDALIENEDKEINLSSEIAFIQQKLNALKQTLQKRERDAKQAEQRKNDLVTYLAHDVKTPLTSVIGYLSFLDETPDMPIEQKAKYIRVCLEKSYRLENLINEFFEITRYNLQTMTLSKKDIDICYMLAQLSEEVYPQLVARGKKAIIRVDDALTVCGDPDKLARAFNNIFKNAIFYGKDGADIEIRAKSKNNIVEIEFKNAGSIPHDKLVSIFEKFYRLDEARASSSGGAGLGLAIAKEIVTLHGGEIRAKSENGYAFFTIFLPTDNGVKT